MKLVVKGKRGTSADMDILNLGERRILGLGERLWVRDFGERTGWDTLVRGCGWERLLVREFGWERLLVRDAKQFGRDRLASDLQLSVGGDSLQTERVICPQESNPPQSTTHWHSAQFTGAHYRPQCTVHSAQEYTSPQCIGPHPTTDHSAQDPTPPHSTVPRHVAAKLWGWFQF